MSINGTNVTKLVTILQKIHVLLALNNRLMNKKYTDVMYNLGNINGTIATLIILIRRRF